MDNSTERYKEKIVGVFGSRGAYGACLVTSTLLRLQAEKVIDGYLEFHDMRSYFRHYLWNNDGINHDILSIINKRLGISIFKGRISQIPPIDSQNVSEMDQMELKELEAGFRRCTTNSKRTEMDSSIEGFVTPENCISLLISISNLYDCFISDIPFSIHNGFAFVTNKVRYGNFSLL